jgi:hypothetical protein
MADVFADDAPADTGRRCDSDTSLSRNCGRKLTFMHDPQPHHSGGPARAGATPSRERAHDEILVWQKVHSRGKRYFLLIGAYWFGGSMTVCSVGLWLFYLVPSLDQTIRGGVWAAFRGRPWPFVAGGIVTVLLCLAAGLLWGFAMWHFFEWRYRRAVATRGGAG